MRKEAEAWPASMKNSSTPKNLGRRYLDCFIENRPQMSTSALMYGDKPIDDEPYELPGS
ncbi:uncharacterized protein MYCFIDRAFT_210508 [Pseudocercospora fijiensis CIRAD86]|uniref:Uncharacterized protein n=1 Tax=Pseudocercospora fijiensis (strain CIRAD86) TaxID=383855 RepID=M3APF5_PSEFD|nr:uncharacterized protein MYCFIDRAFT_210508 [Pseudocercospora fijiensis CIRAD86]EME86496.1 hypothetical protein MYCFIDRAFT_210508 [Pseudocercospora fijiensis CIRAD86]